MSDSGTMTEIDTNDIQPGEAVAAEPEVTEGSPQPEAQSESEYYVEVDADQHEQANDDEAAKYRAIARDKTEKMKRQREAKEKAERENNELRERIERVERANAELIAGKKPKAEDFYGDPEAYHAAVSEWESKSSAVKPKQEAPTAAPKQVLTDDILEEVFTSEERLKEAMPDYEEKSEGLTEKLSAKGANVESALTHLKLLCFQDNVDYAKAVVGLSVGDSLLEKVLNAPSEAHLRRYIKEAASKVKARERKSIDTKPEPTISGGGAVNGLAKDVERAREAYSKSGSMNDFKALQAAKNKLKGN